MIMITLLIQILIFENIYHHHPPQPSGLSLYQSNWGKQFANAMLVNGGDIEGASKSDYILHFLTFGLKVINAVS